MTIGSSTRLDRRARHPDPKRSQRTARSRTPGPSTPTTRASTLHRQGAGTLTVTHTGAITSTSSTNSPGMLLVTQGAGPMVVTTSGDVTATTSTQRGISHARRGQRRRDPHGNRRHDHVVGGRRLTSRAEAPAPSRSRARPRTPAPPSRRRGVMASRSTRRAPPRRATSPSPPPAARSPETGGNGIRAHYQTYAAANGGISVTVGAGASVTRQRRGRLRGERRVGPDGGQEVHARGTARAPPGAKLPETPTSSWRRCTARTPCATSSSPFAAR